MKDLTFEKTKLDDMFRCYSTGYVMREGTPTLLLASEAEGGPCRAYAGAGFGERETVWEAAGGTMSLVEIPGRPGEFLATQRFFPGFQAADSKIVWCTHGPDGWAVRDLVHLPYVHRFDLLASGDDIWLLCATLCTSKTSREDWSDPGKVYVGKLPAAPGEPVALTAIAEGLTRNHGYCRGMYEGGIAGYVTSDAGVMAFTPPKREGEAWGMHVLLDHPVSDVAVYDLDGDGQDELITIEPFHGDKVRIYRLEGGRYAPVYELPHAVEFAHAVWAGALRGQAAALLGVRRAGCELFLIRYDEGAYRVDIIEAGSGPSNVAVVGGDDCDIIICANHTKNEAAVYAVR